MTLELPINERVNGVAVTITSHQNQNISQQLVVELRETITFGNLAFPLEGPP